MVRCKVSYSENSTDKHNIHIQANHRMIVQEEGSMTVKCRNCDYKMSTMKAALTLFFDFVLKKGESLLPEAMNTREIKCPNCGERGRWDNA